MLKLNNTTKVGEIKIHQKVLDSIKGEDFVLCVVTATKPDFYKQWGLLPASKKLGVPVIVINTGQHYDNLLGFGLKEFDITPYIAFDLGIRGDMLQKSYETVAKAGFVGRYLKKEFPKTKFLPIVHGDTLAAGIFPIGWMLGTAQKVAQNEAGLRGMSPKLDLSSPANFFEKQWYGEWHLSRQEPFPEQWDTFVAGASSEIHFTPLPLNREHLIREGYPSDRIFTVGNGIVDTMEFTKKTKLEHSVFDIYPELEKYDNWIRADLHRRINLTESRFKAFFDGITSLIKEGQPIVWVELPGTKNSLEKFNLRTKIISMSKTYDNFVFTPLWKNYAHVMEFLRSGRCAAELTDSGSMQEELNELKIPCLTVRYNTDRPETVNKAHSNILVPPHKGFVDNMIRFVMRREDILDKMTNPKRLYGKDVNIKIIQKIKGLIDSDFSLMRTVPEVKGILKESKVDFL